MTTLKIQNDCSFLLDADPEIKQLLWSKLRFQERNYFHNSRYKQRLWDGYTEFFKRETGKFLTGLIPEVVHVLKKKGVEFAISDERNAYKFRYDSINENFLHQWSTGGRKVTLYDYQVDFINQAIKNRRGVIFSPTGSGKTNVLIGILKALPMYTPTLVLQNRISLAQQNYDEITKWGFPYCGMMGGGQNKPNIITCCTIQSAAKIARLLPKIKCLIVDEIHDMMTPSTRAVYRKLKDCSVRIALSATPFKFGETDKVQKYSVKGFFGPVLKTTTTASGILTTSELQGREILSPARCVFYPIKEPQIPYDIYLDAVTHGIAENFHFHQIVTRLAKKQKGRTIIMVERLAHGDALHKMIPGSLWVRGEDNLKTRLEVIKKLQSGTGDIVAIATHGIFNTGVNFFVHNFVNAAGGQADHQIVQRLGRGLRTANDKEMLNYYDFIFDINEYLLKHSNKRVRIIKEQGHEVVVKEEIDF